MSEKFGWWNALVHGGCLIAPARLDQHFVDEEVPWEHWRLDRVRRALERFEARKDRGLWVAAVLEDALGHRVDDWPSVTGDQWTVKSVTGESIRPRRIFGADSAHPMPLFISDQDRVGVGRGRRDIARAIEWLRAKDLELALVTNGRQWRIVYAGADSEAWAESAVEAWFAEGKPAPALQALRHLLNPEALTGPLREAVLDTRRGQSELSAALGERVRQAVEQLIVASKIECDRALDSGEVSLSDLYTAGVRMVMRLVVLLFAESRELLPMSEGTYFRSYSVRGLIESLDRQGHGFGGNESLRAQRSGWPRLIALFRLVYTGSPHARLPVPEYGGELFVPGDPNGKGVTRAIAALEGVQNGPTDLDLRRILDLITRAPVRIRQGRGGTTTVFPVDFSQLDTEYIGILYEGLLDYELRRVAEGQPQVILNLGDQPILPLRRLENMTDAQLKDLLDKMKVKSSSVSAGEDEDEADEEDAPEEEAEDDDPPDPSDLPEETPADLNDRHEVRLAANAWAKRAVIAARLLRRTAADRDIEAKANELIADVRAPGEFFLVRFGGTRKGSGTFYTVPALAGPTVRRTLDPLIRDENGPKDPEAILGLKVCDPACGSGSFPLAALRHINETLFQSLLAHGWLKEEDGRIMRTQTESETPEWLRDALDESPGINEPAGPIGADERIKARLRRHVVERCLYGIDINPLAVELTRVALWIETMDPRLPFSFLDHKFKVGDALIGCWFDRFQDYPLLAWKREGGDASHSTSVHHAPNTWTRAISGSRDPVKLDLVNLIVGQRSLFGSGMDAEGVHDEALRTYEQLHLSPAKPEEQKRLYLELRKEPAFQRLKLAFDGWCAVWFWPADALAGDDCPTPTHLAQAISNWSDPSNTTHTSYPTFADHITALAERHRFFHWELEYPDVFTGERQGFDAVFGNPPWETLQPSSKEWFSNIDPLYRSYGKQAALGRQKEMFRHEPAKETEWLEYCAHFKSLGNWVKYVGEPFTGNLPALVEEVWTPPMDAENLSGSAGNQSRPSGLPPGAPGSNPAAPGDSPGTPGLAPDSPETALSRLEPSQERLDTFPAVPEAVPASTEGLQTSSESTQTRRESVETRLDLNAERTESPVISLDRSRPNSNRLFTRWQRQRDDRRGYASLPHPFLVQGEGKPYTYKLFLEASLALVHESGRIGLIVPSGLYTDRGSVALRDRFLDQCRWEWLFGFENRNGIFNIHRSFKFCPVIVEKGGRTEAIRTAFMRRDLADWEAAEPKTLLVKRAQVRQFSPRSHALLEVRDPLDVEILETMTRNGVPLGDDGPNGWGVKYRQGDFNMTSDSKLFPPREKWEADGYRADEYGHWLRGAWRPVGSFGAVDVVGVVRSRDGLDAIAVEDIEDVSLPLYEGKMLWQFESARLDHTGGSGTQSRWQEHAAGDRSMPVPQYAILQATAYGRVPTSSGCRLVIRAIQNATNNRTLIPAIVPGAPCGHSIATMGSEYQATELLLQACFASFVLDNMLRPRMTQANISAYMLEELPILPRRNDGRYRSLESISARLNLKLKAHQGYAEEAVNQHILSLNDLSRIALLSSERLRLRCILDAAVAQLYGLTTSQFAYILRDCDHPAEQVNNREFAKTLDPKGFWRVDKTQPPELRHPVLAQVAFADLQSLLREHGEEEGMRRFLGGGDRSDPANDGWLLPETLRLSDYGLGHDARAHQPQPVAPVLGPRFYDWQLAQSPEESWAECRRHAENIRLIRGVGMPDAPRPSVGEAPYNPTTRTGKPATGDLFTDPGPTLFDDPE